MNKDTVTEPKYVPFGWLVAIIGASGTAIMMSFAIGIAYASMSAKQDALASEVAKARVDIDSISKIDNRLVRVETILTYAFPDEATKARARVPASK